MRSAGKIVYEKKYLKPAPFRNNLIEGVVWYLGIIRNSGYWLLLLYPILFKKKDWIYPVHSERRQDIWNDNSQKQIRKHTNPWIKTSVAFPSPNLVKETLAFIQAMHLNQRTCHHLLKHYRTWIRCIREIEIILTRHSHTTSINKRLKTK